MGAVAGWKCKWNVTESGAAELDYRPTVPGAGRSPGIESIGSSAERAFISPTAFEQARGGALGAGGDRVGFARGGLF